MSLPALSISTWRYATGSSAELSAGEGFTVGANYTVLQLRRAGEPNPTLYFRAVGVCFGLGVSPLPASANFSLSDFQSAGTRFTNRCPEKPFCSRDIKRGNLIVLNTLQGGDRVGVYGTALYLIDPSISIFSIERVRGACFFAGANFTTPGVSADFCVLRIIDCGHPSNLLQGGL
ncbi:hypothetical protein [Runella sp.]|uniref:hypothetical protein n=1 Tax=Runella sp. TaxID=1960881 RepID=UPI003D0ACFCF